MAPAQLGTLVVRAAASWVKDAATIEAAYAQVMHRVNNGKLGRWNGGMQPGTLSSCDARGADGSCDAQRTWRNRGGYCTFTAWALGRTSMSLGTMLLVILILLLIGALPTWPYSSGWGYYPSGGLGLVVVILLILVLLGRI